VTVLDRGTAALRVLTYDTQDPIRVGDVTTYEVSVTNQGDAPANNVHVTPHIPPAMTLVDVDGPTQGRQREIICNSDRSPSMPVRPRSGASRCERTSPGRRDSAPRSTASSWTALYPTSNRPGSSNLRPDERLIGEHPTNSSYEVLSRSLVATERAEPKCTVDWSTVLAWLGRGAEFRQS
jgi:uncharacterized repeat protein (TIGR01451 family)